jgi:DNA mismatch repair protein MutS
MRQYLAMKEKVRDAVLFFRMGDFYEVFFEDAELAARELGLTLTTRDKGKVDPVPMAGVPHHAVEGYIARLVGRGYRVAVCDQVGDPAQSKGLVARRITEIVTPGTTLSDALLTETRNNFVAACLPDADHVGFAAADVSTGEFLVEDLPADGWRDAVALIPIAEWVVSEGAEDRARDRSRATVRRPPAWFDPARGRELLTGHFGEASLGAAAVLDLGPALGAGGALLQYLREVRGPELRHLVRVRRFGSSEFMVLDAATVRNLELTRPLHEGETGTTLLSVLDHTVTSLGARRLRTWVERPLVRRAAIVERLDAVSELLQRPDETEALVETMRRVRDLERLLGKAAAGRAGPRHLRALGESALATPELRERLGAFRAALLTSLAAGVQDLAPLGRKLDSALADQPPLAAGDGGVFRSGWNADLDELRDRARGGKEWIARLQEDERARTGIPSLKVGFNKIFGYYIEVTSAHQEKVPDRYLRKQTLVHAERYITPELKEEEERILGAEERLRALEIELFSGLVRDVVAEASSIQEVADAVGTADALASFARAAREGRYARPEIVEEPVLALSESRHPVLERLLPAGEFVPNDCDLDARSRQIAIITGPNMAGKSTFLRQTGLIAILAQMGSFVPAASARLGVVDRVFTRVGASDNIARGQSTFLVEMEETSAILAGATGRSLVLLDEIGRGTSTYDGLSIAWAVTEHLHDRAGGRPRTLFATHYHELTVLPERLSRAVNLTVLVKEWNGKVVFLRRIVEGAADRSYGIHVAELAGLPGAVVDRAREILQALEDGRFASGGGSPSSQLTLFEPSDGGLLSELRTLEPEAMTPLEALSLLTRWKRRYGNGGP